MNGQTQRELAFAQVWELYRVGVGRLSLPEAVRYLRRAYKAAETLSNGNP